MVAAYNFHPVGQGLFGSGSLWTDFRGRPFRWVYDCGTSSKQNFLRTALNSFQKEVGHSRLNLVVISHFDSDHISGIVELLNRIGTDILMLPWAALWHRLVIAYQQNLQPSDPIFQFYVDPIKYLNDEAGDGFERIVFVPFSDGDGPPDSAGTPSLDFDPDVLGSLEIEEDEDFKDLQITKQEGEIPDWLFVDEWHEYVSLHRRRSVSMMRQGSVAQIVRFWEFVTYNDPATQPIHDPNFVSAVNARRDRLLRTSDADRQAALDDLKHYYLGTFPQSKKNDLSLFLYGGPIGGWHVRRFGTSQWVFNEQSSALKGSILYTGDGTLASQQKWSTLANYVSTKRAKQPSVFQVPHHGSRHSWFDGLADEVEPDTTVFCSDPSHLGYQHPHSEVKQDFQRYRCHQVDETTHFHMIVEFDRN